MRGEGGLKPVRANKELNYKNMRIGRSLIIVWIERIWGRWGITARSLRFIEVFPFPCRLTHSNFHSWLGSGCWHLFSARPGRTLKYQDITSRQFDLSTSVSYLSQDICMYVSFDHYQCLAIYKIHQLQPHVLTELVSYPLKPKISISLG